MVVSRLNEHIGRVLGGRYRLIAPIGTGASAMVFLADDTRLRRRVAVKVLHSALADDEGFLRRFRAEAQAAAALSHANILAVYDWGDEDGEEPYLVMEHLGGGSLRDVLDTGYRLTPAQALLVGLETSRALDHAHRQGFVHRDIKPANLLFGEEGRLRVADFGLARALAEAAWTEPAGAMIGTARYACPEQARGEPLGGKGDVYSLALVLVESVTGTVPFATDTTIATLMARIDRPIEVPESLGPLRPILVRAGNPDPALRPDAGELAIGLLAAAGELERPTPLPLSPRRVAVTPPPEAPAPPAPVAPTVPPAAVPAEPPVAGPFGAAMPPEAATVEPAEGPFGAAVAPVADGSALDDGAAAAAPGPSDVVGESGSVVPPIAGAVPFEPPAAAGARPFDQEGGPEPVRLPFVPDPTGGVSSLPESVLRGMELAARPPAAPAPAPAEEEVAGPPPQEVAPPAAPDAVPDDITVVGAPLPRREPVAGPPPPQPWAPPTPPTRSPDLGPPTTSLPAAALLEQLAEAMTPGPEPVAEPTGRRGRRARRREVAAAEAGRPRRTTRVLIAVVVALATFAAGFGAYKVLYTPSHKVARLIGLSEADATAEITARHWKVTVDQVRRDGSVAGEVLDQAPAEGADLQEGKVVHLVVSLGQTLVDVPGDLVGKTVDDATAELQALGLTVGAQTDAYDETVPKGSVLKLGDGTTPQVEKGKGIDLVVSQGPAPRTVPSIAPGTDFATASAQLGELGLAVSRVDAFDDNLAAGTVISLDPGPGTQVAKGSTVTVKVSKGKPVVPDVRGRSVGDAVDALQAAGFTVAGVQGNPLRTVAQTNPPAGTQAASGTAITIITR